MVAELFLGAIVSLLVEFVKTTFGTKKWITISLAVLLSLLAGLYMWSAKSFGFWQPTIQILGFAGAAYTFIIKNIEDIKPKAWMTSRNNKMLR